MNKHLPAFKCDRVAKSEHCTSFLRQQRKHCQAQHDQVSDNATLLDPIVSRQIVYIRECKGTRYGEAQPDKIGGGREGSGGAASRPSRAEPRRATGRTRVAWPPTRQRGARRSSSGSLALSRSACALLLPWKARHVPRSSPPRHRFATSVAPYTRDRLVGLRFDLLARRLFVLRNSGLSKTMKSA